MGLGICCTPDMLGLSLTDCPSHAGVIKARVQGSPQGYLDRTLE